MANARQLGFHYAWVVLAAAVILNIVARADQASFGVFIDPLVAEFGWQRGDISFAYSLAFLIGLPAVVIMGWLGDRYGARELMLVSAAMISVGTVMLGTIKELWQFYLVYALLVGSTGHSAFSVLLPVIMTRWFYRRLGIAMGIYFAAQGIGPVLFAPLFRKEATPPSGPAPGMKTLGQIEPPSQSTFMRRGRRQRASSPMISW